MLLNWILPHLLFTFGFLFAAVLVIQIISQRRTPGGTNAWLLLIVFLPYAGVPLYLMFGGRKMRRIVLSKGNINLLTKHALADEKATKIDHLLRSHGIPGATTGNQVTLCPNGIDAYNTLIDLIENAVRSVHITTYVFKNDTVGNDIIARLERRAKEGVDVRVLTDSVGTLFPNKRAFKSLIRAGGKVERFMPMIHIPFQGRANLRNHRKLTLIDGRVAWAGGANIANEYIGPTEDSRRWKDLTFTIKGPAVRLYEELFHSDWDFASGDKLEDSLDSDLEQTNSTPGQIVQVVPSGPDINGDPLYHAILSAVYSANKRLWIVTPYFIPETALTQALSIAARRGIDLRIVVPEKSNHPLADWVRRSFLREIEENGGKILYFNGGMVHAKALILDDQLVMIGSANIDVRSLLLNYEVSTLFYDKNIIKQTEGWIEDLMKSSHPKELKGGLIFEFLDGLGRILSPLL